MVKDPEALRDADTATLVVESGRHIEGLAKALVTARTDADGKPLMLGERMRELKARLDEPTWRAYRAWAAERNAYVHAEQTDLTDRDQFFEDYRAVATALGKLQGKPRKRRAKASAKTAPRPSALRYVLLALLTVALTAAYYTAC